MHAIRMSKFNLRRSLALGASALAMGGAATGIAAEAASAAGPVILPSGADTLFPTWWGGMTTVCARGASGTVRVSPFPYFLSNTIDTSTNPYGETCTRGSWWGNPVKVSNQTTGNVVVRSF
jgi:hypothetical protein